MDTRQIMIFALSTSLRFRPKFLPPPTLPCGKARLRSVCPIAILIQVEQTGANIAKPPGTMLIARAKARKYPRPPRMSWLGPWSASKGCATSPLLFAASTIVATPEKYSITFIVANSIIGSIVNNTLRTTIGTLPLRHREKSIKAWSSRIETPSKHDDGGRSHDSAICRSLRLLLLLNNFFFEGTFDPRPMLSHMPRHITSKNT